MGHSTTSGRTSPQRETQSGVRNTTGASQTAVAHLEEALRLIGEHGIGIVEIGVETARGKDYEHVTAKNPRNKDLEAELVNLARENGLSVEFRTETKTTKSARRELRYGYDQYKTQTKRRIMAAFPR